MLGALSQRQGEYRVGKYLDIGTSVEDALFFQYEQIMGERITYSHIIQNLITSEKSVFIKTNYAHDWKLRALVQLQNGKLYHITNLEKVEEELNPQSFSILKQGSDVSYYMELVEVANADNYNTME